MGKFAKFLLALALVLVMLLAAMILLPRYVMGIDIFDLSGWTKTASGEVQYLDYRGDPLTGWQNVDDNWYYFDPADAAMATGWTEVDGKLYYFDRAGVRRTGWLSLSDGTYYVDPESACVSGGWLELEGDTYYLAENGRVCTGIAEIDGNRYFLGKDGKRGSGWTEIEGKRCYLSGDGIITTGWADTDLGRCYFLEDGTLATGWADTEEGRYYLTENGTIATGWLDTPEGRLYLDEEGQPGSGWMEIPEGRTYLNESGFALTGWQELDGNRYYFHENGVMAIGKVIVDDQAFYFDSTGKHVYLVNRWNAVPEDYQVKLVTYSGYEVAADAYDDLVAMINQLKTLGYYKITSMYRSEGTQQYIWNKNYDRFRASGYSKAEAERLTGQKVAIPGTSEHHLGYAVDIDGSEKVHNWLAEHSWEYGFIVRYPEGKTEITGIIHEPWHFRYVGKELAKELYQLGLTLEEYMDMLTEKAGNGTGTASNPENITE